MIAEILRSETLEELLHFSRRFQFDHFRSTSMLSDGHIQEGAAVALVSPHPLQELQVNSFWAPVRLNGASVICKRSPENS